LNDDDRSPQGMRRGIGFVEGRYFEQRGKEFTA